MSEAHAIPPSFGAGGAEPYAMLLGTPERARLALRRVGEALATMDFDVAVWRASASDADDAVLAGLAGPLLDVGCGPGRMVRAADARGLAALGVDVSLQAAAAAATYGTRVLRQSVFDPLPGEGRWQSVLLMDGNVGIGGDPLRLLARCAELLAASGVLVVEVHGDPDLLDCDLFTAMDDTGGESAPFPWALVGRTALVRLAAEAGLVETGTRTLGDRSFVLLGRVSG